jgi:hypothetical protein
MARSPLSEATRQFLREAIGSVERLDILLFLQRHAERRWTLPALADAVRMPEPLVEASLDRLASGNLVDVRIAQEILYQYSPGTNDLRQLITDVVQAHYRDRRGVIAVVASPVSESARLFADAFRLRRPTRDG